MSGPCTIGRGIYCTSCMTRCVYSLLPFPVRCCDHGEDHLLHRECLSSPQTPVLLSRCWIAMHLAKGPPETFCIEDERGLEIAGVYKGCGLGGGSWPAKQHYGFPSVSGSSAA